MDYFNELTYNRWFGQYFDEYMLLGYIGDRERFQKELERKGVFSKLMKIILPELKISSLIKQLIGFELLADKGTNVFEKIYDTLEDEKNRRTITEH